MTQQPTTSSPARPIAASANGFSAPAPQRDLMLPLTLTGYGIAALLMLGFAWVGVVPLAVGLVYVFAGVGSNLALSWLLGPRPGLASPYSMSRLITRLAVNTAVQLSCIAAAPQIGGLLLMIMLAFLGIGAGALRMPQRSLRHWMALAMVLAALAFAAFSVAGAKLGIPVATTAQRWVSAASFGLIMVYSALLGQIFTREHRRGARTRQARKTEFRLLQKMAWLDDLTGLANRRALLDKMDQRLHSGKRQLLAIGLIDLDNFKDVNDRLGHATGDALLIEVGKRLSRALGPGDVLARLGGDEFAILLSSCQNEHQLRAIAARLLQTLENPILVDGQILQIGLSMGLVLHDKNDTLGPDALLRRADLAMYAAKHSGRSQYRIFDLEMERKIHQREHLLNWVKDALRDQQLELHYQPILTVEPGKAEGDPRIHEVEALLRLRDHDGLHNAGEFEAVLDDTQLAIPIGRFVLDAALSQLLRWHQAGLQLHVCVNISPQHFLHPQFLGDLRDLLERHPQCSPEWLVLELTEHGSELNSQVARFVVTACRRLGIRVSLDDFGTGSASLTHLQLLEASAVKIDRSFTHQLFDESADLSITYGLLRTAQMMGLSAVAEGVRTPRQAQVLAALGCRKLQGYAIAKPMSAKALEAWLQDWPRLLPWAATLAWQKAIGRDAIHAMVEHGRSVARAALGALDDGERQRFGHAEAHRRCALGRWCESQTGQYGHVPGFRKLMHDHHAFHASLRTIAEAPAEDAVAHAHRLKALSQSVREQFWNLLLHPLPRSRVEADDEGQAEELQAPPRQPPELPSAMREPEPAR